MYLYFATLLYLPNDIIGEKLKTKHESSLVFVYNSKSVTCYEDSWEIWRTKNLTWVIVGFCLQQQKCCLLWKCLRNMKNYHMSHCIFVCLFFITINTHWRGISSCLQLLVPRPPASALPCTPRPAYYIHHFWRAFGPLSSGDWKCTALLPAP